MIGVQHGVCPCHPGSQGYRPMPSLAGHCTMHVHHYRHHMLAVIRAHSAAVQPTDSSRVHALTKRMRVAQP